MNQIVLNQASANQFSSIELLKIINQVRNQFGESQIRLNDFHPRVFDELEGEHYETFVVNNQNNTVTVAAFLNHDQCILVAMRESKGVRRKVLEILKQQQAQIPQTYAEALQLAANQARQLELAAPKVEYYDKIVERSTLLNASQVAQKIKISAVKLNKLLDIFDVYHKGVKRARLFQQWFIDKGFGEVKQTELGFSQPMFTTKGEAWVIEKLTSEGLV
ncbi:phage antirepressor KilAC domain-containing protein [Acinetobacter junii]|jgi:phage antirepressor YoqD-like protein|uniref:Phage antirepressor KilAC domain-containing protein n=1 Tax=Acinetobacter junii TaxID=40215 RepID=A0AAW5R580_ACIJU|nr:phage antirepressor KilAC domain-containing protein [Acinetobacter junii]MCU4395843.1 phage antirepressor KilAC domain-containing protein [Acinetobacter junii]